MSEKVGKISEDTKDWQIHKVKSPAGSNPARLFVSLQNYSTRITPGLLQPPVPDDRPYP